MGWGSSRTRPQRAPTAGVPVLLPGTDGVPTTEFRVLPRDFTDDVSTPDHPPFVTRRARSQVDYPWLCPGRSDAHPPELEPG